jgi:hypothetical protein
MTEARPQGPLQTSTRCPYCFERNGFKVMIAHGSGCEWFMCASCGHLALLGNPLFVCTRAKCVGLRIA